MLYLKREFLGNPWLLYPILLLLAFPLTILVLLYASALFVHLYKFRTSLITAYSLSVLSGAKRTLAAFWDFHGKIWHGYELHGVEKLPSSGPGLLVYYHAVLPVDMYYLLSKLILHGDRVVYSIGDHFLFKVPGLGLLLELFCVTAGKKEALNVLNDGHLITVSPGGVREALFSDSTYRLLWGNRVGFAKLARQVNCPIFPVYTQNCREAFLTPAFGKRFFRWLYERTRLPICLIYGGFPVKLRTFIGDPILPSSFQSAEQLAHETQKQIENLIRNHQRVPGTIFGAICDRFASSRSSLPRQVKDS